MIQFNIFHFWNSACSGGLETNLVAWRSWIQPKDSPELLSNVHDYQKHVSENEHWINCTCWAPKEQLAFGWRPITNSVLQKALTQAEKRRNVELSSILSLQNSQDTIFGYDLFFTIWRTSTVFTAKSMKNCHYLTLLFQY